MEILMRKNIFKRIVCMLMAVMLLSSMLMLVGCDQPIFHTVDRVEINDSGELVVYYYDGTEENLGKVVGTDGEKGEKGDTGDKGDKGDKGDDGIPGTDGVDGSNGADGKDGSIIINGEDSSLYAAISKGMRSTVSVISTFNASSEPYSSGGAGVIYKLDRESKTAFIITNYHVVYDSKSDTANGISDDISIYLYGSEYKDMAISATYVGGSMSYDIAVLYVENSDLLFSSMTDEVALGDSDKVCLGDTAIAIGNPEAQGLSATAGIINVDSEYITMTGADNATTITMRVMRTDAAVNHGNSGGGLYNSKGELIGIVNAKEVSADIDNIGYAIPVNLAVAVADNIIRNCFGTDCESVRRATVGIGVTVQNSRGVYDPETGKISIVETVAVTSVREGALADGKFEVDDVFVRVILDGKSYSVTRRHHLIDLILMADVGDTVEYVVLRGGAETSVYITITEESVKSV